MQVPIRPQSDPSANCAIRTMGEGGDDEKQDEVPAKRRRRIAGTGGACASAEMEKLREGLGMNDEGAKDMALSPEEATGDKEECEACSDGEERGVSVETEGE